MTSGKEPEYLYRYVPPKMDWIRTPIVYQKIFFPSVKQFNDPFDCATGIRFPDPDHLSGSDIWDLRKLSEFILEPDADTELDGRWQKRLQELVNDGVFTGDDFDALLREVNGPAVVRRDEQRFLCLSEDPKNIPMWSHYADKHKGVALQFKPNHSQMPIWGTRVRYRKAVPSLAEFMTILRRYAKNDDRRAVGIFRIFYGHKHTMWRCEKEWRVMTDSSDGYHKLPAGPLSLTGVILGLHVQPDTVSGVNKWVRQAQRTLRRKLRIYRTTRLPDSFSLRCTAQDGHTL